MRNGKHLTQCRDMDVPMKKLGWRDWKSAANAWLVGGSDMKNLVFASLCCLLYVASVSTGFGSGKGGVDATYVEFLENRQYKQAYEYVSRGTDRESILQTGHHLMFGAGVEKNNCKAVLLFEGLFEHKGLSRPQAALNFIYNFSWGSIAAIEGSADASFLSGLYYFHLPDNTIKNLYERHSANKEEAYRHFMRAERFGSPKAREFIEQILEEYPDMASRVDVSYEKQSVICPVREDGN